MASEHDRRRFFKELLREVAEAAHEVSSAIRSVQEPSVEEVPAWRPDPPRPAAPARGSVSEESLLELCRELGLEPRADDVRRLARQSVRLTRGGSEETRSRLGASPDVPPEFEWPTWEGRELGFAGQIVLPELAATGCGGELPPEGLLLFFYDFEVRPSGLDPSHRGSCRVLVVDDDLDAVEPNWTRTPALRSLPIELSCELMLPGAWSFQAGPLELEPDEAHAWDELRGRLAAAQGVELEESLAEWLALHRLFGYQEEMGRELELDCQLAASGVDADDFERYYELRDAEEPAAREWRLLLQLSTDETLATPWDPFGRLYFFIRDEDLQAGNLEAAWAILR